VHRVITTEDDSDNIVTATGASGDSGSTPATARIDKARHDAVGFRHGRQHHHRQRTASGLRHAAAGSAHVSTGSSAHRHRIT
jgi:hypothetical protein